MIFFSGQNDDQAHKRNGYKEPKNAQKENN
jgi:hypothetical protein